MNVLCARMANGYPFQPVGSFLRHEHLYYCHRLAGKHIWSTFISPWFPGCFPHRCKWTALWQRVGNALLFACMDIIWIQTSAGTHSPANKHRHGTSIFSPEAWSKRNGSGFFSMSVCGREHIRLKTGHSVFKMHLGGQQFFILCRIRWSDQSRSAAFKMTVRHMLNGYITADNLSIFIIFTVDKHHVPHPNCPSLHITERWHGQRLSACARRSTGKPLAIIKYVQQLLLQVYFSLFHYKRTKVNNIKSISIPCKTSGWWSQPVHNKSSIVSIFPKITCKLSSSIIETANQTTHILPLGPSIWRKISEHPLV